MQILSIESNHLLLVSPMHYHFAFWLSLLFIAILDLYRSSCGSFAPRDYSACELCVLSFGAANVVLISASHDSLVGQPSYFQWEERDGSRRDFQDSCMSWTWKVNLQVQCFAHWSVPVCWLQIEESVRVASLSHAGSWALPLLQCTRSPTRHRCTRDWLPGAPHLLTFLQNNTTKQIAIYSPNTWNAKEYPLSTTNVLSVITLVVAINTDCHTYIHSDEEDRVNEHQLYTSYFFGLQLSAQNNRHEQSKNHISLIKKA